MAIKIGTFKANTINGTFRNDLILGLRGGDTINAGAGNDVVFAGLGNDRIFAGNGNDWVFAGAGNDMAYGGNGNDFLFGDAGSDVLDGGRGSDRVDGGSGNDTLIFTDAERGGRDNYIGGSGQDTLVLEFAGGRWADAAVRAEVISYLNFLGSGGTGNFTFTTMNLVVSSLETLVVRVDGVIVDPRATGNTAPSGVQDSFNIGENGVFNVSPATGNGTLVDNDNTGTGAFTVELVAGPARGALTLNADGTFSFNPGTAFDYLAAGQSASETFTYAIVNSAGTSAPITVTLNIAGANDAASISGILSGTVLDKNLDPETGDPINTISGQVSVTDADSGQAQVANPGIFEGTYGSLALSADGSWTYTLNDYLPPVLQLGEGVEGTDVFNIVSLDGSANAPITITVVGANDLASLGGDTFGSVNEDGSTPENEGGTLTASGTFSIFDEDIGEAFLASTESVPGLYGSLDIAMDGSWTYTLYNEWPEVQALRAGETVIDVLGFPTLDGTNVFVSIAIEGSNDTATVSGDFSDTIYLGYEDTTAAGSIIVEDVDNGESGVEAGFYNGTYGDLTLNEDGTWSYQFTAFDLAGGEEPQSLYENFALQTLGGDNFDINIEISDGFLFPS